MEKVEKKCDELPKANANLDLIKRRASMLIQPMNLINHTCTIMLIEHLNKPEWLLVPCDLPLLDVIICTDQLKTQQVKAQNISNMECPLVYFIYRQSCIHLMYFLYKHNTFQNFKQSNIFIRNINLNVQRLTELSEIITKLEPRTVSYLSCCNINETHCSAVSYKKVTSNFMNKIWQSQYIACNDMNGVIFQETDLQMNMTIITQDITNFICNNGSIVFSNFVCDGKKDCLSGEDEEKCDCNLEIKLAHCIVKHTFSQLGIKNSSLFAHMMIPKLINNYNDTFYDCLNNYLIPEMYINDGFPDCPHGEDEVKFKHSIISNHGARSLCEDPSMIQCYPGFNRCYYLHQLCNHIVDFYGNSIICRNGAHLNNCTNFICNRKHKCPQSHCIPYNYVCNGRWDCPRGEDEKTCNNRMCPGQLKCKQTSVCVHHDQRCDGVMDCPVHGEDELLCNYLTMN